MTQRLLELLRNAASSLMILLLSVAHWFLNWKQTKAEVDESSLSIGYASHVLPVRDLVSHSVTFIRSLSRFSLQIFLPD